MKDPHKLFNTRLDSKTVRAIDFHEGDAINEAALSSPSSQLLAAELHQDTETRTVLAVVHG